MEKLKDFLISFFEKSGAKCRAEGEYLIVENADKKFEAVYQKRSPYRISFSRGGDDSSADYFYNGSRLFSAVMSLLNQNASSTILRINIDLDPLKEVQEKISLDNCIIQSVKKDYKDNFFSRFTFQINFKYLNKNEEILQEIFVHNNKIIKGDLKNYDVSAGDLQEVDTKYMKEDYIIAKNEIKEIIKPRVAQISKEISVKLAGEIERIKKHYEAQLNEVLEARKKRCNRLEELKKEKDSSETREKKKRLEREIALQNMEELREAVRAEEEFAIADERQKHTVNVDTKLMNSTVLYYPKYLINILLRESQTKRVFQIVYDPLTSELSNTECSYCNAKMKRPGLCKQSHVCCSDCLFSCASCGARFCKRCLKYKCNSCGYPLCTGCKRLCNGCGRTYCKEHILNENTWGESYCSSCLDFCSSCSSNVPKKELETLPSGKTTCLKCKIKEKKKKILMGIFEE
jgi:hypothetical protein